MTIMVEQETKNGRRYKRGERGLETMEKRFLASNKMKRFVRKMSSLYSVQFVVPKFVPVFRSTRMRTCDGYHYSDKITIDKNCLHTKFYLRSLLWHEIIHSFVSDNYHIVYNEYALQNKQVPSVKSFEKDAFRYGCGDGSHESQNWKVSCDCGMWLKSVAKKNSWVCPRCNVTLVSTNEYQKLKKIAQLGSRISRVDINRFKPWKSNERIKNEEEN